MFARLLVGLWLLAYGKYRVRGTGFFVRFFSRWVAGLRAYPLDVPGVGRIYLDCSEGTCFSMLLRLKAGDLGTDAGLYQAMGLFLKPGGVLWDVGAYVGYLSAYFAHPRFGLASIQAFEPNPATLAKLRQLFANSAIVQVHPFALGSAAATLELSVQPNSPSMASVVRENKGGQKVPISVRVGDAVQQELNLPLPDVIKIDVEGFEAQVLAGLAKTLSRKRPVVFFEHIFLSEDQIKQLVPAGYNLFFIGDDGRLSGALSARSQGHDAFLVPADHPSAALFKGAEGKAVPGNG